MSKELEALESIKRTIQQLDYGFISKEDCEDFQIIETALKEHEAMKQTKIIVADDKVNEEDLEKLINQRMFITNLQPCEINLLFDEETRKKLKALEIIKECFDVNGFDELVPNSKWFKSKEKRDLVRNVLL